MATRYFKLVSTRDYAKIAGISVRAAQRRVKSLPGAVQSNGNRWVIPVPATTYARAMGVPVARVRRESVKAQSPTAATSNTPVGTLKSRAAKQIAAIAPGVRPVNPVRVNQRLGHANRKQLIKIIGLQTWPDQTDSEWEGDDNESILFYH